ncbi:hypothetical protein HDU77_004555 [Chytriomyces hyalinus]|nr:hypothetical protein HDU77_004555 [Chytriomyces hyalinus]
MNDCYAHIPEIHYLTLEPEYANATKDEDGKPVPVEGSEPPVFLEDIPGMTKYPTDKGLHFFLEAGTRMFIAYFKANAIQKCF